MWLEGRGIGGLSSFFFKILLDLTRADPVPYVEHRGTDPWSGEGGGWRGGRSPRFDNTGKSKSERSLLAFVGMRHLLKFLHSSNKWSP